MDQGGARATEPVGLVTPRRLLRKGTHSCVECASPTTENSVIPLFPLYGINHNLQARDEKHDASSTIPPLPPA